MPRSRIANETMKEKQRKNIVTAARKIFALKGSRATIADISSEAGISQGLVYRYFSSKEELLLSIMHDMMDSAPSLRDSMAGIHGTPVEKIQVILSRFISGRKNEPYLYQFLYQALVDDKTPDEIRQKMTSQGYRVQNLVRDLIVEGQEMGEIAGDDPDQLVLAIFGCLEGAWRRMAYLGPTENGASFPDCEIIMRMLKPC